MFVKRDILENNGCQTFFQSLGRNGCYMLSLIEAGYRACNFDGERYKALYRAIHSSGVNIDCGHYGNENNFYVKDAEELLKDVFGGKWKVKKSLVNTDLRGSNTQTIIKYVWEDSRKEIHTHFKLKDWDSIRPSFIETFVEIDSFRIVKYLGE